MRVAVTVSIASATWSYVPGQIVEIGGDAYTPTAIPDDIGAAWLESGHVVPLDPADETADRSAPETETRPKRGRR